MKNYVSKVTGSRDYQCCKCNQPIPTGTKFWETSQFHPGQGWSAQHYCDNCIPAASKGQWEQSQKDTTEDAAKYGLSLEQYKAESQYYLQCEGYDDAGNQYDTFGDWLKRKPIKDSREPFDGGRGAGMLGVEG